MVHMVVVGSLLAMIVFITISNPRDTRAFLVALNFLTMAFWILVDLPGWPGFMQSLVPAYSIETFILRDAFFILSLQVLFSISIHILLVFPCRWLPDRVLKLLLPVVYAVPTGVLLVFALFLTPRPIVDNLTTLAEYRLQFDTILLIIVCGLIVTSYRLQKSPIEKEQARWILRAMLTVGVVHLGIWNIPKILFGEPLVLDYAWMQLLLILIPLSFTVTIANHHLFGIQGLARRRLSILESLLSRERSRVQRRDGVIQDLTSEIEYLKEGLRSD